MIDSVSIERLRGIGLTQGVIQNLSELQPAASDDDTLLRITQVHRESVAVHDGQHEWSARALPALHVSLQAEADTLAVGDWVLAHRNPQGEWWLHHRLLPRNQLARRLHDGRDKVERTVIVSNVDTALLVMGLDLDFSLRRLERYVALVRLAGIEPVVVLTKADLHPPSTQQMAEVHRVVPASAAVCAINALDLDCSQTLAPWLGPGQTLVLLGSSGAGKSSLTNSLCAAPVAATGAQRAGDGRGRHTTTTRSLFALPQGACVIDTPGLRTLRLDGDAQALGAAFDDIASLAAQCRFRDCRHAGEPGCAVRGHVSGERLKNYGKLLRELQRDQFTALQRKAQQQVWKLRSKAARARAKEKVSG
jgi:ribosome biogenesis GTPase / thiamine phosphate phosphatase